LPGAQPDPRRLNFEFDGQLLIHVVYEMPQTKSKIVGLMSLKAGTHQLNLTNSIEGDCGVKRSIRENGNSHELLGIH